MAVPMSGPVLAAVPSVARQPTAVVKAKPRPAAKPHPVAKRAVRKAKAAGHHPARKPVRKAARHTLRKAKAVAHPVRRPVRKAAAHHPVRTPVRKAAVHHPVRKHPATRTAVKHARVKHARVKHAVVRHAAARHPAVRHAAMRHRAAKHPAKRVTAKRSAARVVPRVRPRPSPVDVRRRRPAVVTAPATHPVVCSTPTPVRPHAPRRPVAGALLPQWFGGLQALPSAPRPVAASAPPNAGSLRPAAPAAPSAHPATASAARVPTVHVPVKPVPAKSRVAAVAGLPPVSAGHYIRSLVGRSRDRTAMVRLGAADALRHRGNHTYLVLLDIGGQVPGGVRESTTRRVLSYGALVSALSAYLDGYHAHHDPAARTIIAVGTNNDLTTGAATGATWARSVVNPLRTHAARYVGIEVAGADDIEPGFQSSPAAARRWVSGYLSATSARLVYNGSADGCSPTHIASRCNHGWHATDIARVAGAAAPGRITALPQVYNPTMARQWARISRTSVAMGRGPLHFAGVLTENAACGHNPACPTMPSAAAYRDLVAGLRSDRHTAVTSLPSITDLDVH
jgi:hypothetical protein